MRREARGLRRAALGAPLLALLGCGTAVYTHTIRVAAVNAAQSSAQVAVFDPQNGNSRDWAHRHLGATPLSATISTTATVTMGSAADPRPFTLGFAIPELTDSGYFLLEIAEPVIDATLSARFCAYGEYFPVHAAHTIPVTVSASADRGHWQVGISIDLAKASGGLEPGS
jgi:hypothetical protein